MSSEESFRFPRSGWLICAAAKAVLTCSLCIIMHQPMAASSDLCVRINVPCLFWGEKHVSEGGEHSCCGNTCRISPAAAMLQIVSLRPASLCPVSCLGHPAWVSTLTGGTGVQWDGVTRDGGTVVTLSFRVDSLRSGASWRNPSWNTTTSMKGCVKRDFISKDRQCRWVAGSFLVDNTLP